MNKRQKWQLKWRDDKNFYGYEIKEGDGWIARLAGKASGNDAAFIVHACNNFDQLLEALRETVQSLHDLREYAQDALTDHLERLGETITKNKLRADAIRADIASADIFINSLK